MDFNYKELIEIHQVKETKIDPFYNKNIWISICNFLPVEEICKITLLNKKFYQMINKSKLIWMNLEKQMQQKEENQVEDSLENSISIVLEDSQDTYYPNSFKQFQYERNQIVFIDNYWDEKESCEEKKILIEKHSKKNMRKIMSLSDYNSLKKIETLNKLIAFFYFLIPTFLLIFVILIEIKMKINEKIKYSVCFIPFYLFFAWYFFQMLFLIYSKNKKWEKIFYFNNIKFFSNKKLVILFNISIIFILISTILVATKLDSVFKNSWNYPINFLYLSFTLFYVVLILDNKYYKSFDKKQIIVFYIFLNFFFMIVFLFRLSLMNILSFSSKWFISFVPFYIVDTYLLVNIFYVIYNLICHEGSKTIIGVFLIFSSLTFISTTVLVPLSSQKTISTYYAFTSLEMFLVFFQIFVFSLEENISYLTE